MVSGNSAPDASSPGKVLTIRLPSGEEYYIHSAILGHVSAYFHSIFVEDRPEHRDVAFRPARATKDSMALYVGWVYAQSNDGNWLHKREPTTQQFLDTWLLADDLMTRGLQQDVQQAMVERIDTFCITTFAEYWDKVQQYPNFLIFLLRLTYEWIKESGDSRTAIECLPREALEMVLP